MMKKMIPVLFSMILSLTLTSYCFADNVTDNDCRSFADFFDSGEFSEVMNDVKEDYFIEKADALSAFGTRAASKSTAYKLHDALSASFIKKLSEGMDISELISPDYSWIIPAQNTVTKVILNDEGRWEAIGYGEISPGDFGNDTIQCDEVNSTITDFLADSAIEIKDMICINAPMYFTNFVYVTLSSEDNYLIPFGQRPDFTGLTNGVMYSVDEVYSILSNTMGEVSSTSADNNYGIQYGGVGFTANQKKQSIPLSVVVIPAIAIVVVITIATLIWNRSNKRNNK